MRVSAKEPWLKMALNNAWANETLYAALLALPAGAFTARRPGFFPSLSQTMNHIYAVDRFYIDALTAGGKGRSVYDRTDIEDPPELAALQAECDLRFATFCRSLTPETLASTVRTDRGTEVVKEEVAAILLHLVQHQIHHRGQAHVQLSTAGEEPPQLDDFYLEFGRVPSAARYW